MTSRLSRFLHLERSRAERPRVEEPSRLQNGGRFEAVAGPVEPPATVTVPEAHLERFKRHGETPLALEEGPADARSFQRCFRCEAENGRFVQACGVCGADLGSPEQREYSEERWRAQAEQEARAREARKAEEQRQQEAKRRQAEALFAGMAEGLRRESRGRAWLPASDGTDSLGLRLLRLVPEGRMRQAVGVGCVAVPLLLMTFGEGLVHLGGYCLGLLSFVLFVPPWLWRVRR
jgi:hypothetical protein